MADAWSYLPGSGDAWERMCGVSGDAWGRLSGNSGDAWARLIADCNGGIGDDNTGGMLGMGGLSGLSALFNDIYKGMR